MTDISDDSKYQEGLEEEVLEDEIEDDLDINSSEGDSPKIEGQKKTGFVKQFVSSKQPFYKMSLPISYNEPRSLLEKFTDMGLFLDIFLETPTIESEEDRFLEILKFYLSGWIQQKETKNPFNPIIGEVHTCEWKHKDSTTQYIAEQISHHPPSSAFCFYNIEKGVILHSYLSPTSKFWGNSFESSMEGKIVYELPSLNEEYIVEAPKIVVKGVVVGSLQTETVGSTNLVCKKTGYSAEIEFKGRGGIFKNKVSVIAKVKHTSNKKSLYTVEGKWDGTVSITSAKTNDTTLFLDINKEGQKPILPSNPQENYSGEVWKKVIENMLSNNEDEAQKQKALVEETQRTLAKTRESKQEKWESVNFSKNNNQDTFTFNKLSTIRNQIINNFKK